MSLLKALQIHYINIDPPMGKMIKHGQVALTEKEAVKKKLGERGHLINATTVDGRLLVGGADCEDLRQGGRRSSEGGKREVGLLTFESKERN